MKKKVLVPVAIGVEEIETMCIVDILRRANANVTIASVNTLQVKAAHGVILIADCLIEACRDKIYDLIVLPGGLPGAENLRDSSILKEMLITQKNANRLYGAICASPVFVLAHHKLVDNLIATAYPALIDKLPNPDRQNLKVVVDKNCVTSKGPGTAMIFALKLVELLYGEKMAKQIAKETVVT
jgi:4-methyl-5(b-hydroxyethyl)-thiazole monophosphate biosynthesis